MRVAALTEQLIVWKTQAGQKELRQMKVSEAAAAELGRQTIMRESAWRVNI